MHPATIQAELRQLRSPFGPVHDDVLDPYCEVLWPYVASLVFNCGQTTIAVSLATVTLILLPSPSPAGATPIATTDFLWAVVPREARTSAVRTSRR